MKFTAITKNELSIQIIHSFEWSWDYKSLVEGENESLMKKMKV